MLIAAPRAPAARGGGAAVRGLGANPGLGIAFATANGLLLSLNDVLAKLVLETMPVGQFIVLRGTAACLLILGWLLWTRNLPVLRLRNRRAMALYSLCMIASTFFFLNALHAMPLGDAVAISFAAPIFTTALAALVLKEKVGWRRWTAVAIGFVGVVVLLAPAGQGYSFAVALLPLAVAVFVSVRDIASRRLSATDASVAILFYNTLAVTLSGVVALPFEPAWIEASTLDLVYTVSAALLLGLAQFSIVESYRLAEVSLVMPFRYVTLIFAALCGFAVWGDIPTWNVALGAAVISASGLFIWHRERVRRR